MQQAFFDFLSYFFLGIFSFIPHAAKWCLDGFLWLLGKFFFIIFDGILTAVSAIFMALDFSSFLAAYAMSWAGVPEQMIWLINAVSIPAGIVMLSAAIGIRMAINLIPSWATRF